MTVARMNLHAHKIGTGWARLLSARACMSLAWLSGFATSAVAGLAASLFGGPRTTCECVCAGRPDEGLLELLRVQLDRCGPPNLAPACPVVRCEAPSASQVGLGSFAGAAYFAAGWLCCLVSCYVFLCARAVPSPLPSTLSVSSQPSVAESGAPSASSIVSAGPGPLTPAAKRVRYGASSAAASS